MGRLMKIQFFIISILFNSELKTPKYVEVHLLPYVPLDVYFLCGAEREDFVQDGMYLVFQHIVVRTSARDFPCDGEHGFRERNPFIIERIAFFVIEVFQIDFFQSGKVEQAFHGIG